MNAMRRIDPRRAVTVRDAESGDQTALPAVPPVIDSKALFDGCTEILISHSGAHYRLTITRQGKLILTK